MTAVSERSGCSVIFRPGFEESIALMAAGLIAVLDAISAGFVAFFTVCSTPYIIWLRMSCCFIQGLHYTHRVLLPRNA